MHTHSITGSGNKSFQVTSPGKHMYVLYNFSGTLDVEIVSSGAEVLVYGIYYGADADSFSLKTNQHHKVGQSSSNLLIKGVFKDTSRFQFEGLIRIEPGAHESQAYQKNQNLILDSGVFVDSRPFLEILADDVRCTHGSTTGRLNADHMLFGESRGITPQDTQKMLVDGFIDDVFKAIKNSGCDSITRETFGI